MKVILTGATGYIGSGVLEQCLKNPEITSIIVLSRKELPEKLNHPKIKVVIVKDFGNYSQDVIQQLQDAEACLW